MRSRSTPSLSQHARALEAPYRVGAGLGHVDSPKEAQAKAFELYGQALDLDPLHIAADCTRRIRC